MSMIDQFLQTTVRLSLKLGLAVVFFSQINCATIKADNEKMNTVRLFYKLDLIDAGSGKLFSVLDSTNIIYYQNYVLYEIPYAYNVSNVSFNKSGDMVGEKVIEQGTKSRYFVYQKDSKYGLKYDSINVSLANMFSVDSFLNEKAFKSFRFEPTPNNSLEEIVHHQNSLLEKFSTKTKYDDSYYDSSYYYYTDKMKDIDYSFSKTLDSLKAKKLFRVRLIYNPIPKGGYNFEVPRREFLFELKENTVRNKKEIINLFERFKKENTKR